MVTMRMIEQYYDDTFMINNMVHDIPRRTSIYRWSLLGYHVTSAQKSAEEQGASASVARGGNLANLSRQGLDSTSLW